MEYSTGCLKKVMLILKRLFFCSQIQTNFTMNLTENYVYNTGCLEKGHVDILKGLYFCSSKQTNFTMNLIENYVDLMCRFFSLGI